MRSKKLSTAHANMATKKRILEGLTASGAPSDSAYRKAMTAMEKSTIAFDKAVDGVKSLIGTGSGNVPLVLPATYFNHGNHHDKLGTN